MNELILSTTSAPAKFSFKSAKLNEISAKIAEQSAAMDSVYNAAKEGAEAVNKALAPLFGELMASKCYKDDGFKSVADYAAQTFGMSKAMAYMLARVGEAFYNTGSEDAKKARETLSTSKLAELTSVDKKEIGKALDSGELTQDTPLVACRDFATAHKKPGKEKVVQTYNLYAMCYMEEGNDKGLIAENVTKDELPECAANHSGLTLYTSVKVDGDKPSAAQHFIMYAPDGGCAMFEYRPYVKPASKGKGKREKFDLAAYIAALSPEEREALAAMVSAQDE